MFQLKPIHKEAIASALEKAVRYRVLNEPLEAESICRDVLSEVGYPLLPHAGALWLARVALLAPLTEPTRFSVWGYRITSPR